MARDEDEGSSGGDEDWAIAVRRAEVVRRLLSADGPARRSELIAAATARNSRSVAPLCTACLPAFGRPR